jgi:predicted ATPase
LTRFLGREEQIALLVELLRRRVTGAETPSPTVRLVTLTGPAGIGKTRLAIETAERLMASFVGAVSFVSLVACPDKSHILDTIRDSLQIRPSPTIQPLDQVIAALEQRPSLLVLDNFEHLLVEEAGESGAAIVGNLLEREPTLTCLVTSR